MPSIAQNIIAVTSSASSASSAFDNDSSFEIISDFESEFEDFEASEAPVASDHSKSKRAKLIDGGIGAFEAFVASDSGLRLLMIAICFFLLFYHLLIIAFAAEKLNEIYKKKNNLS